MYSLTSIPPGLFIILGALLIPIFSGRTRNVFMLVLPTIGLAGLLQFDVGIYWETKIFNQNLTPVRIDDLSLVFGYIFHLAAIISVIYAFHIRDTIQQVASLVYSGSAIGAVFAGDLITLFVYWEITAISSVFLIWANRTERSYRSGMRYLVVQVASGVLLLSGSVIYITETGSINFDKMSLVGFGPIFIFVAFGIKAAFPLVNGWLHDAYPNATATGTVFLSAFTTKLAIYALARGFPNADILIWIGCIMATITVIYALLENDLRRVMTYSLNTQLGLMVIAVGIGSNLALNGAVAHAFTGIVYKSLLFMVLGAVLVQTGTTKANELGGLRNSMPWTAAFAIIGAASISAFPFFIGFPSKSLILSATAYEGYWVVWGILLFASAGVFFNTGIRIPYLVFFGKQTDKKIVEAPANMLVAMGITSIICLLIGIYPKILFDLLPFNIAYEPYTMSHIITQIQLLSAAALVYVYANNKDLLSNNKIALLLDVDWFFRRGFPFIINYVFKFYWKIHQGLLSNLKINLSKIIGTVFKHHGPEGVLARTWPTGSTVLWVAILLALYVIVYFV